VPYYDESSQPIFIVSFFVIYYEINRSIYWCGMLSAFCICWLSFNYLCCQHLESPELETQCLHRCHKIYAKSGFFIEQQLQEGKVLAKK